MAVSQEALTILLPLYMLEIGSTPAFAALVVGLRGVGVLLFDVPAGMLVARFGDKPVLVGGLSLIFSGLLLLSVTTEPLLLGFAAVALGSGHAAWMLGRQSYLADVCATVLALEGAGGEGAAFPLAIDLHAAFLRNQKDGVLEARAVFVKRGRRLSVVRTSVTGDEGRVLVDVTTSHVPAA